jgi:Phage P22-like portal protein
MDQLARAKELYFEAVDCLREQRQQIEEDLAFSDPSDPEQWEPVLKHQRETDPGGKRPCLTFDQLGQYVANVAGQVEQRPPSIHTIPVDSGADRKAAAQLDGLIRHVEYSSRATGEHYPSALTAAARTGVGYLVIRPEYCDRALGYQEPRISCEPDPLRVVLDPWSTRIDGSDADFGYILTPFSKREFGRKWKGKDPVSFSDKEGRYASRDDESIVVAECWQKVEESVNLIIVDIGPDRVSMTEDEYWAAMQRGEPLQVVRTYTDKRQKVMWSRMSGADVLDKAIEYPSQYIGIVPVYGYVGYSDGRMRYCGIPRRARAAQQAYNYHMSEMRAYMSQAPKSPWIVPDRAIGPYQAIWDKASVESRSYLPYRDLDDNQQPISAPQRMPLAINLQNHASAAEQSLRDIQAAIGMYQASLGAPSNESSGIAIESRKQQGEAATAHFQTHLAASLGQVGRIIVDMIPRLIDTPRQMRILGFDGSSGSVQMDPEAPQAMAETPEGLVINPARGKYDVRVVVGASYSTQRTQAQAAFSEMMRANPQMTPAIAPLWAKNLDVPEADKLAQVLIAVAPPEVQAVLKPEGQNDGPSKAEVLAKMQEMQQALAEATQIAQELQAENDKLKAESDSKEEEAEARVAEMGIKAYEAETKRLQALSAGVTPEQVQLLVQQTIAQMFAQPDPMQQEAEEPEGMEMPEAGELPEMEQPEFEQSPDMGMGDAPEME